MKKGKIIQVVEFYGREELLKYRLDNFDRVDKFIIVGDISDDIKKIYKENVHYLESKENETYDIITNYLIQNCENFEDIIIISDENEFCDFDNFDFVRKEINFSPFFINHFNFWWGKNYFSETIRTNSFIFSFSHLLRNQKLIKTYKQQKGHNSMRHRQQFMNGWCFNGFYENNSYHKENLLPKNDLPTRLKIFKKNIPTPKNFEILPDYDFNKQYKIIVVFDETSSVEGFDKIVKITFGYDMNESFNNGNNIYEFKICLPKKVLYGDKGYDEFIEEYKQKEILKIINLVRVSDRDVVEIKNPS